VLGAPFFLMEEVLCDPWGDFSWPDWMGAATAEFRYGVSEQIVQTYARLHCLATLAWLGPVRSAGEELERWLDPIRHIAPAPLAEAFALLLGDVPSEETPCPCHGDAKIANLLWKDGRVVALIDYEMSFNGDPRWVLAATLQGLRSEDGQGPWPADENNGF
jgi:aminoglycoside phosphotransferase (APT) family kinase protein